MPLALSFRTSVFGTELLIRDVRFHGEYWRWSGLAADAAGSTQNDPIRTSYPVRGPEHVNNPC
jgi:hypothetical protein